MPDVATKMKVMIVGGDASKSTEEIDEILDYTHIDSVKDKISLSHECQAVVVLVRWCNGSMFDKARAFAKSKDIPFIRAKSWNYIIPEMIASKLLPGDTQTKLKLRKEARNTRDPILEAPQEPALPSVHDAPAEEPVVEVSTGKSGLSIDEMWEHYGKKSIDAVQSALKPGEKIHEDDLIAILSGPDWVGLPRGDALNMIPELAVRGAIVHVKGKTWKRIDPDSLDFGYEPTEEEEVAARTDDAVKQLPQEEDEPPVPVVYKIEDKSDKLERKPVVRWIELLTGVGPGPYSSQSVLWKEALSYEEFSKPDGTPLSETYYWNVIPKAIKYGAVIKGENGYTVNNDENVILTRRKDWKPKKAVPEKPEKKAEAKELDHVECVQTHFEFGIPTLDRWSITVRCLKKMIPALFWDSLACRKVAEILEWKVADKAMALKEKFGIGEWDRLAYEYLKERPISELAPFLKDEPKDVELTCMDCAVKFTFTIGEQRWYAEKFKDGFSHPKRCKTCRDKMSDKQVRPKL